MKQLNLCTILCVSFLGFARAQWPDNFVVQGVPDIPNDLKEQAGPYLEFRAASFSGWHPRAWEMFVLTRFADVPQLHRVAMAGGARRQLTFGKEPIREAVVQPKDGRYIVFARDKGGSEFYQLFRLDLDTLQTTLLTDGRSRNMGPRLAPYGQLMVYTSTRRNGRDNDLYLMNPEKPDSNRLLLEVKGGGWRVSDWSPDQKQLLIIETISINESRLHLLDVDSGARRQLTATNGSPAAYVNARFDRDGKSIFVITDHDTEFRHLVRLDPATGTESALPLDLSWGVDEFELSPDGKTLAILTNEEGTGVLRLVDVASGRTRHTAGLPPGIPSGLEWHNNGFEVGFTFSSAQTSSDAYTIDVRTGQGRRWTESETGGLSTSQFVAPELVKMKSFDGQEISAFVYRPDPKQFPGPRPVLLMIHGGPESQSRPRFLGQYNYLLNELGLALVYPNVRGSSGYGKTFLTLDNGFKREDSVRDIGTVLDWVTRDPRLNRDRIAVMGGSYGGYMTLACMVHYNDRLRCGVDIVGISNFKTFLENTQDYRRDLRRVEYGDERDAAMRAFLERISPANQANKIKKPLFVIQGQNDPRVPVTESEQMVKAIREAGGKVWYMMARDEGHGFRKKNNSDLQFLATVQFLREHLIEP